MHADPRSLESKRKDPRTWWARVEVQLVDGRRFDAECEFAHGTNGTSFAMDDAALEAKFRSHAAALLSPQRIK